MRMPVLPGRSAGSQAVARRNSACYSGLLTGNFDECLHPSARNARQLCAAAQISRLNRSGPGQPVFGLLRLAARPGLAEPDSLAEVMTAALWRTLELSSERRFMWTQRDLSSRSGTCRHGQTAEVMPSSAFPLQGLRSAAF